MLTPSSIKRRMRSIFVLEEQAIGQIAAGEVVDRPAAVVKELIEDSIDAGSTHIVVAVGNGGSNYIRLTDDGSGICEEDTEVARIGTIKSKYAYPFAVLPLSMDPGEINVKREERIKVLFSTAACKASIKAGEKLSYDSMRAIVAGLRNAKIPFTCPHGRPTMIRLTKKEIEKRFKRRSRKK